ncbi:MAG: hypothetical protein R2822_10955 [Spirosomataceae bacterium]
MRVLIPTSSFHVTLHAQAIFEYFLRNPIAKTWVENLNCRFSHPRKTRIRLYARCGIDSETQTSENGNHQGFRVLVGGGLGAQPIPKYKLPMNFLEEEKVILSSKP